MIALVGAACAGSESGTGVPVPPPAAEQLKVTLSSKLDTLLLGTSKVFSANVTTVSGAPRSTPVQWSAVDPTVATVAGGQVTAIGGGETFIIARAGAAADTARLVVRTPNLELWISPSAVAATLGDTVAFEATLVGTNGANVQASSIEWQLSDSSSARIIGDGALATLAEGEVRLTARVAGSTASASVKIVRAPLYSLAITPGNISLAVSTQSRLTIEPRDDRGRMLIPREYVWTSSKPSIASVDKTGLVTAIATGGAIITATMEGKSASAAVNVSSAPAKSVTLTLPNDSLAKGRTMQAVATPLDANGAPIVGRPLAWQSSNPAIATINNLGLITGILSGQTTISVICDGKVASQLITIDAAEARSITIVPVVAQVLVGSTSTLTAEVRDQFGVLLPLKIPTWSSATPAVANVSAAGLVTGVAVGTATVRAALGNLSQSAVVTVQTTPVASVTLAPSTLTLQASDSAALVPTARDVAGNVLAGRPATWSSSSTAAATVSATGLVSAVGAGSSTVTVTVEGKTATVAVTVSAKPPTPVASVTVSLGAPVLSINQSTQGAARTYDASTNELFGRSIAWSSENPAVATVNAAGLVTAVSAGSVTILATSEGQTGVASVTVSPPLAAPVASVALSAARTTLNIGDSTQVVVTLKDAANAILTGRTVTFANSNSSVATVSPTGQVVAKVNGSTTITATSEGKSATLAITVSPATPNPVATVTVVLNASSISVGQNTQGNVTLADAGGNVLTARPIVYSSSNTAVATVSQAGLVSGIAAGSATISAVSEGKTGSAPVTVVALPAVVASVSITPSSLSMTVGQTTQVTATARDAQNNVIAGRTVAWSIANGSNAATVSGSTSANATLTASTVGVAAVHAKIDGIVGSASVNVSAQSTSIAQPALPQLLNFSYPQVTGRQWFVNAGGSLQAALNSAQRGDEIVLEAGATFIGHFTLQPKPGTPATGWIIIRSSKLNQLPIGKRVMPADAGLMPKIMVDTYQPALQTAHSASGYWIAGVELTVDPAMNKQSYGIVLLGDGTNKQNALSLVASDLVLDRVYIHGAPNTVASRCVGLNSARTVIQDSYVNECHGRTFDAQAIAGWNGPGPFKIVNNTLAGSGENVMFGGSDPDIANLIPSDIEFRRNYVYTPPSWKNVWMKKNLLETKNAQRLLIEGNVFDGSWQDGQAGYALMFKSANQSGRCTWCTSRDITVRHNIVRNAGAGITLAGREGSNPYAVGELLSRVLIEQNIVEDINTGVFVGDARLIMMIQNPKDITIRNNTMTAPGALGTFLTVGTAPAATDVEFSSNVVSHGTYGLFSSAFGVGENSLKNFHGMVKFQNVVIISPPRSAYTIAQFAPTLAAASLTTAGANVSAVNAATAGVVLP
jgi:trimeric autotransporter adhesin